MPLAPNLRLSRRRYVLGLILPWEAVKYFRWWIVAAVVVSVLGPLAFSRYTAIETSVWSYTANVGDIFTAIVGGAFLYALIPTMVANSLTRRELAVSYLVFGLLFSLAIGVLIGLGYFAEHAYYDAFGWIQGIDREAGRVPLETWSAVAEYAVPTPLVVLLYFIGGSLIGAASYRWEGVGWLISVPVAVVVFGLDSAVFATADWGPTSLFDLLPVIDEWDTGLAVTAAVAAAAGGAAIGYRLLIDIPVRAKKA